VLGQIPGLDPNLSALLNGLANGHMDFSKLLSAIKPFLSDKAQEVISSFEQGLSAVDSAASEAGQPDILAFGPDLFGDDDRDVASGGVSAGDVASGGVESGGVHSGGVQGGNVESGGVESGDVQSGGVDTGGVESGGVDSGNVQSGGTNPGDVGSGGLDSRESRPGRGRQRR